MTDLKNKKDSDEEASSGQTVLNSTPLIPQAVKLFGAMALVYSAEVLNATSVSYIENKFAAKKNVKTDATATNLAGKALSALMPFLNAQADVDKAEREFRELMSKHDHVFNEMAAGRIFKNLHKYEAALKEKPTPETINRVFNHVWETILSETEIKRVENHLLLPMPDGEIFPFLGSLKILQKRKKVGVHFIWDFFPSTSAGKEFFINALVAYCHVASGNTRQREAFSSNMRQFLSCLREDLKLNEEKIEKSKSLVKLESASEMTKEEREKVDKAGDSFWTEVIDTWNAKVQKEIDKHTPGLPLQGDCLITTIDQIEVHPNGEAILYRKPRHGETQDFRKKKRFCIPVPEFKLHVFNLKEKHNLRRVPPKPSTAVTRTVDKSETIQEIKDSVNVKGALTRELRYDIMLVTLFNSIVDMTVQIMAANNDKNTGSLEKLKLSQKNLESGLKALEHAGK